YALRRLLITVPLLLAVSLVVFSLANALPGDAAATRFDLHANPEEMARWRAERGLDDPFFVRWGRYVWGVAARLDFDRSYVDDEPVGHDLVTKLQATLELTLCAMILGFVVGVTVGILSAVFPRSPIDSVGNVLALAGISMPVFWLGMLLIVFAVGTLGFAYSSTRYSPDVDVDGFWTHLYLFESFVRLLLSWTREHAGAAAAASLAVFSSCARNILLPALALSTIPMAIITRMTRSAMLEEIDRDYARTARAKGLRARAVVLKHVLRNALIPITTITGLQFGRLLGGAVLTETVFSWPGLGRFIVQKGVASRDTPIIVGGILLVAATFVIINLVVDLLYAVIDPRVRRGP
ncbi:MAG: ABC transporter permease, partial [Planctomycetota bacterium]